MMAARFGLICALMLSAALPAGAQTLTVVPGKSMGPIALGMTEENVHHFLKSSPNSAGGNDVYSEEGWHGVIDWSPNHATFGTLRLIYQHERVIQIEIRTEDVHLTRAALDAAYPDAADEENKMIKAYLLHLIVVTTPLMKTPFKAIRQSHPGMQVSQFSDTDNFRTGHSYYYIDDVAQGIAFTFLAEDRNMEAEDRNLNKKKVIRDLAPEDVPERIIIHLPKTNALAIYEGENRPPSSSSPYLSRIRAWFAENAPQTQQKRQP